MMWISLALAAEPCARGYLDEATLRAAPEGAVTTFAAFVRDRPAEGVFTMDAWVNAVRACPPCPEGASCKPCESHLVVSDSRYVGIKQPITDDDLVVSVSEARLFSVATRYRLTFLVCPVTSIAVPPPRPALELRGFAPT